MKKYLSMLLAGVMVCSFVTGCGKNADNNAASDSASVAADVTDAAATESSETGLSIDFDSLTANSLKEYKASDFVTLGEYDGVLVEAVLDEVTEEKIEEYIENLKVANPPMTDVTDRAVQDGDSVNIDYVGKFADTKEAFDGGTAQGQTLVIGSGSYIEGFESGLIGTKVGETVDLDLTFPENYGAENLAGKAVVFTVTVNGIQVESGDITDEWAAGLGYEGVSTLDELKTYVEKTLKEEAQSNFENDVENAVISQITDNAEFANVPEELINWYMKQQNQLMNYRANLYSYYYGQQLSVADVLNMYIQNEGYVGTPEDYLKKLATDMANQYLLFQAIADEKGLTVTDEEIDEYLKSAYDNASTTSFSSFEEYKESLDLDIYREGLMAEKVVKYIVDNAKVVGGSVESGAEASSETSAEASSEATAQ